MRKILALTAIGVVGLVGVAQAKKPTTAGTKSCKVHKVGYNAVGTLVSSSLTAGTTAGHFSGTITVTLKKANHHDMTTTFTLTNARVIFHHGVASPMPAVGSRVGLHGKITAMPAHCSTTGFTPTITIKKVDIRTP
ncbi:MAG TPA: hypothetical protein VG275_05040 [Solirubrobacteraceae bacterium]|nr:hypothetical protein [Solirubrobacteraceae bacterium]